MSITNLIERYSKAVSSFIYTVFLTVLWVRYTGMPLDEVDTWLLVGATVLGVPAGVAAAPANKGATPDPALPRSNRNPA